MNSVVSSIWFALEAKSLKVIKDCSTNRSLGCSGRISGTKNLSTEVFPAETVGRPRDSVPLNLLARVAVRSSHRHVKTVHDVDILHLSTIKSTTKFDQVLAPSKLGPFFVETFSIQSQLLSAILGIVNLARGYSSIPILSKGFLELLLALVRDVQFRWLQLDSLACDRTVVRVDVHVLVDFFGKHFSLFLDRNSSLLEFVF
mmetsp:Transcript_3315/g.5261  ORF Transcript_3315/g.5261 Transcript_3315/m.5261 type:complete len:201 (-) Transcript_3315:124-726(-)